MQSETELELSLEDAHFQFPSASNDEVLIKAEFPSVTIEILNLFPNSS